MRWPLGAGIPGVFQAGQTPQTAQSTRNPTERVYETASKEVYDMVYVSIRQAKEGARLLKEKLAKEREDDDGARTAP